MGRGELHTAYIEKVKQESSIGFGCPVDHDGGLLGVGLVDDVEMGENGGAKKL